MTCHTSKSWRKVNVDEPVAVRKVEMSDHNTASGNIPSINRQTEEGFERFKAVNPTARQCNGDTQFDPSLEGVKWVHMEAKEVFDDGENHIEYECLHCGEHYHIYLPD